MSDKLPSLRRIIATYGTALKTLAKKNRNSSPPPATFRVNFNGPEAPTEPQPPTHNQEMTENLPSDESMSALTQMGQQLYDAEQAVLDAEARLKHAKRKRDALATQAIPSALEEMGIESLTMTGGRKIEVKPILSVTPLAANRPRVMEEVTKQGAESIIKTTVSVPFGRGEQEAVKALLTKLQEDGLAAKLDTKIEPQTLKKHVKERLEAGLPVDTELFGVREFSQAKFTEGKPTEPVFDGE